MYQTLACQESAVHAHGIVMSTESLIDCFSETVLQQWPQLRSGRVRVVAAVSGGADSVAMLRILHHALRDQIDENLETPPLWVAHYNHRLRGEASDQDQQFVENLATKLGLKCLTDSSTPDANLTGGSEDHFRRQRYAFLDRESHRIGARYVSVAHNADDQVETVLHQLFRGSSLTGLSGIPRVRPLGTDVVLIRPVLVFRSNQLRELLGQLQQPWREDVTNSESDYQRNWLRNQLLPAIRSRYPDADAAVLRAAESATAATDELNKLADRWIELHVEESTPTRLAIRKTPSEQDNEWDSLVTIQALTRLWGLLGWPRGAMNQWHWDQIRKMIATGFPVVHNLPGNLRASVNTDGMVVEPRNLD